MRRAYTGRKPCMFCRRAVIFLLTAAIFMAGGIGAANGVVLRVDEHGQLTWEFPHLCHAHGHAGGAHHGHHDWGGDAEHAEFHALMGLCSHAVTTIQKLDQSRSLAAAQHVFSLELCLPARGGNDLPLVSCGFADPALPGSTAHLELACLHSVVLLA